MECVVVPRLGTDGRVISASTVRRAIQEGRLESVRDMLPDSTFRYFSAPEAADVVAAIAGEKDVIHY